MIQSVLTSIDVLDCFSREEQNLGISDISRKLGLNRSRVHRILLTLEEKGFVVKDPGTMKYRLGLKLFQLGHLVEEQIEIRHCAHPYMQKLVNETEETVNLNVIYNGKRMSIKKIESPHDIRQAVTLGKMLPLYSGAPGKVLMAFLPSDKLEDYLKETELQLAGPNTITDRDELLQELEKIRKCRYAISREETYLGAFSIAAPVWDFSGNVTAALSVTGPVSRFSDDRIREFVPLVINAARSISVELGYQGDYLS
jgi:DNA-binding IclR family transcriptional regulator